MWQASIYKGKLFTFNYSFAWKSLWQVVFELCFSEIQIAYNFELKVVFIEKTTGKSNLQVYTRKNKLFET